MKLGTEWARTDRTRGLRTAIAAALASTSISWIVGTVPGFAQGKESLPDRYGREQIEADIRAGLRSPEELRELFGDAAPSYASTVVWPSLRVRTHASQEVNEPNSAYLRKIVVEGVVKFFDNLYLISSGISPTNLLLVHGEFYHIMDKGRRVEYLTGNELSESVADRIANHAIPTGCGGYSYFKPDGTVEFAYVLANPLVLDRASMIECIQGRLAQISGYRLREEVKARYAPDDFTQLVLATINAIYACAATEPLDGVALDTRTVPDVDLRPFPDGACIVRTAIRRMDRTQ